AGRAGGPARRAASQAACRRRLTAPAAGAAFEARGLSLTAVVLPARTLGLISFLRAGVSAGPEVPDRRIAPAPAEAPPQMMVVAERAGRAEGSGWHPAVAAVRPLAEIWLAALAIALLAVRSVSRAQPCPDLAPAEHR